jgi:hypothetical protein
MVVTQNEQVITNDVMLKDSSKITKDAVLVKKNGGKVILNENDCIDIDGNILAARFEKKTPQEDKKKKGTH